MPDDTPTIQQLASETEINPQELNVPHKPHHFLTKKVVILGIVFLGIVSISLLGTVYVMQVEKQAEDTTISAPTPTISSNDQDQVVCTMGAKICPDGSSVGRVPPSCEFAACPE